ncbi:hypothetical protein Tco_1212920 [Tanacetum coccineum]
MLLMQAQENGAVLDEEQLLFIVGGQTNTFDNDEDEAPVQDLALNKDNVFQANQCDVFDSNVDEAPMAQTMFMANLSSADPIYDEAGLSYDSDILSKVQDHDNFVDIIGEYHEVHEMQNDVQPNYVVDSDVEYTSDSNTILYEQYVKDNAVPVVQIKIHYAPGIIHDSEDTLEIIETTRKKMNEKMKDQMCVKKKVKIIPPEYSNENYLGTITPQKQLALKQIFWFDDILKENAKPLKAKTNDPKSITTVTVYPPNTPAKLVPRETLSKADRTLDFRALDFQITELTEKVTVLKEQNKLFRKENAIIKQHYKVLYDSIKITRAKTVEKITALLAENENLKAKIIEKINCVTMNTVKPKVLAPGMYAIDVEPIPPRNRNNRQVHLDYLKHLKESVETYHEIVKEARIEKPLDNALGNACFYTKRSQELLEYVIGTCTKEFNKRDKKIATTPLIRKKSKLFH